MSDAADRARRRASLKLPARRWPLVLPHAHIRRVLDRKASLLILSRTIAPSTCEVHDAATIRRNLRHVRNERPDLQQDPLAFTIEIANVDRKPLGDVSLTEVRDAGFKTTAELHEDWLARRHVLNLDGVVHVCVFHLVEARYLHKLVARGYTTDPADAVADEPEALDEETLQGFADQARERYALVHADEISKREARSLANQLREAHARATLRGVDVSPEIKAIQQQLDQIREKLGAAA